MEKYIDLHVHSSCSDGTMTPKELVHYASVKGLCAIALTDHDTVSGVEEALYAANELKKSGSPIRVIPGVELSAGYGRKDIHILGLFVDHKNEHLLRSLTHVLSTREQRNEKMAENLRKAGIDISIDKLKFEAEDTVITRAHFARFLTEQGYVKTKNEAFDNYLNPDSPYYVPREYIPPETAIELIKNAGGIAVLAHPLLYKLTLAQVEELIDSLVEAGIEGIETIYSANSGFDEGIIRRFVNKHNLLMTGGSDFHGFNKPHIEIGIGKGNLKIPYSILERLEHFLKGRKHK